MTSSIKSGRELAKTILLTFDVELFFGRSGSLGKCILEPVEKLTRLFSARGITATFFVDILHYMRLAETRESADEGKRMRDMMQSLVSNGHRVELHLHPHWLDAVRADGEWTFPTYRHYRLQTLPREKITDLFVSGSQALNDVAGGAQPGYKTTAFRAGGYCIHPFTEIAEGFRKSGIRVDSSIAKGFAYKSETHDFDYTGAPERESYRFQDDPLTVSESGEFLEVPITTYRKGFLDKARLKAEKSRSPESFRIMGDGKGMVLENVQVKSRLLRKLAPAWEMFSLDNASRRMFLGKAAADPRKAITVVSHPKMLMPESFHTIEGLADAGYAFDTVHGYAQERRPASSTIQ